MHTEARYGYGATSRFFQKKCKIVNRASHAVNRACHYPDTARHAVNRACHYPDTARHAVNRACHHPDTARHAVNSACHYPDTARHRPDEFRPANRENPQEGGPPRPLEVQRHPAPPAAFSLSTSPSAPITPLREHMTDLAKRFLRAKPEDLETLDSMNRAHQDGEKFSV